MRFRKSWRAAIVMTPVVFLVSAVALADDVRAIAKKATSATVWVEWQFAGQPQRIFEPNTGRAGHRLENRFSYTSGTVLSPDGVIVTLANAPAVQLRVHFANDRTLPAKVLVVDNRGKIKTCLLKVEAEGLDFHKISNEQPQVGDSVIAATATGPTNRVVARGIVSAKGHVISGNASELLQTDVRVGRAGGGGPLLNAKGDLIGMIASTAADATFAIPASRISKLLVHRNADKLVTIRPGFLGVTLEVNEIAGGVIVGAVHPETPADKAGLKSKDVILKINDRKISKPQDVQAAVAAHAAGTKITVEFQRGDKKDSVEVVLAQHPNLAARQPELKFERVQPGHWEYVLPDGRRIRVQGNSPFPVTPAVPNFTAPKFPQNNEDIQKAIEQGKKWLEQNRGQFQPPAIRVFRADSDKRIEQLTEEVEALRDQVETLTKQLKLLQKQLKNEN